MTQSIFEKISDKILEIRPKLLEKHSEEEVEKFLSQAYTLASLQVWDKYVDVFSEEGFATLKLALEQESSSQEISALLGKYNINPLETEEMLLQNFEKILNS